MTVQELTTLIAQIATLVTAIAGLVVALRAQRKIENVDGKVDEVRVDSTKTKNATVATVHRLDTLSAQVEDNTSLTAAVAKQVDAVEKNTNSLSERLAAASLAQGTAEGIATGRQQIHDEKNER